MESLAICDQLRDVVKEKDYLEMRAGLYLNLGLVYNLLESQEKNGMKYIEKALAISININVKTLEFRCHFSLGEANLIKNHPAVALQCFERARKVAQHQKSTIDEADTLFEMGKTLLQLGDFKSAKNILKRCFKTMKHGNMADELRSCLIKAIKGTKLMEKVENHKGRKNETLMKTFEDLGDIFSSVKCFPKALEYYLKQLELSEKLGASKQEKAVICYSVAQSYSDDKQYDKSKEYFQKELLLRENEPEEQCDTWCNIGEVCKLAGDSFEEIEKAYKKAIECAVNSKNASRKSQLEKLLSKLRRGLKNDEQDDLEQSKIENMIALLTITL